MSNPPSASARIADQNGLPTRAYYRWMSDQAKALTSLTQTVSAIPTSGTSSGSIIGGVSVRVQGTLDGGVVKLTLLNDVASPGNSFFYGTSTTGAKGWHPVSDVVLPGIGLIAINPSDGTVTLPLSNSITSPIYLLATSHSLSIIESIAVDGVISTSEKPKFIREVNSILGEKSVFDTQATYYSLSAEKAAYDSAVSALTAYLATLTSPVAWNDTSGDTTLL